MVTSRSHLRISAAILLFMSMADYGLTTGTVIFYFTTVGGSLAAYGWMSAIGFLTRVLMSGLWDELAIRLGRRRAMILSSSGIFFATFLLSQSHSILGLVIARIATASFSGYVSIVNASCLDSALPHRRLKDLSFLGAAQSLGGMTLGPLVGAYLWNHFTPANPYLLAPILALINLVLVAVFFRDTSHSEQDEKKKHAVHASADPQASKRFKADLAFAGLALLLIGFSGYVRDLYFPLLLKTSLHLSWIEIGYVIATGGVVATLLPRFIVPKIEPRMSTTAPVLVSFGAIFCSQLVMVTSSFAPKIFLLLIPIEMILNGIGLAITMPAMATLLSFSLPAKAKTEILGKLRFWSLSGGLIASPCAGYLFEKVGPAAPYVVSIVVAIAAILVVALHAWNKSGHKLNQTEIDAMITDWYTG